MSVEVQSSLNGKTVTKVCIPADDGSLKYPIIFHRIQQDIFEHPFFVNRTTDPCIMLSKDRQNAKGSVVKEYGIIKASDTKVLKSLFIDEVNIHANELLYSNLPRKLYIDIDLSPSSDRDLMEMFKSTDIETLTNCCIQSITKIITKEFPENKDIVCNPAPKVFLSERAKVDSKKSAHILFPGIVFKDLEENKMFVAILRYHIANDLSNLLDAKTRTLLEKSIDFSIYTTNRAFRLPYQSKMGKTNRLLPQEETNINYESMYDYLVGIYTKSVTKGSFSNVKLLENGTQKMGDNCVHKMRIPYSKMKRKDGESQSSQSIDKGVKKLLKIDYNIVEHLRFYKDIPSILIYEYTNRSRVEFYLACIPNHDPGQDWIVWWAIGQALKNIESDESMNQNKTEQIGFYLDQWIKWTCKSKIYEQNAHSGCSSAWQKMKVRDGDAPKFKYKLLSSIARIYYKDNFIDCYDQGLNINELFCMDGVDHGVFSFIDKYNGTDKQNITEKGYCKPYDFDQFRCIVSQAPMGSGKTYQIKQCLKDHKKFKRVLVLSPRQTFSKEKFAEFSAICPDFMHYQSEDVKEIYDWSSIDKLVIQVESLVRFPDIENARCNLKYDLLILDEIESILYQFSSTTNRNVIKAFQVFISILQCSKYIIMADAFVTKRTLSLCKYLKNQKCFGDKESPSFQIKMDNNLHNPNKDKQAIILSTAHNPRGIAKTKELFLKELHKDLKAGKKICIVSSSRIFIDEIIEVAKCCGLDKKSVCVYDSITDDADIDALQNVQAIWMKPLIRLVVYTTKITVGINFDLKGIFHKIYIYGSVMCPNIRDLMQAHFRVRHTIDKQVVIAMNCFDPNKHYEKDDATYEGSRKYLQDINEKSMQRKYVSGLCTMKNEMNRSQVEIYDQIVNYNKLEDVIGLTCYYELFHFLLKWIGYNITNIEESSVKAQDETKETENDSLVTTKFQLFPASYVRDFICHREISDRDKLVSNKKSGCALKTDKIRLDCHYFYKTFLEKKINPKEEDIKQVIIDILGRDKMNEISHHQSFASIMNEEDTSRGQKMAQMFLRRMKVLKLSFLDTFQTEVYNKCYKDKNLERWIQNISTEIDANSNKCPKKDIRLMVMEEREQQLRLRSIQEICVILGIDYSFDYDKTIGDHKITAFVEYLQTNPNLEKLFHIRKTSTKYTKSRGLTVLSGILSFWNGCSIAKQSVRQRYGERKKMSFLSGQIQVNDCLFSSILIQFNSLSCARREKQQELKAQEKDSRSKNQTILLLKKQIDMQSLTKSSTTTSESF